MQIETIHHDSGDDTTYHDSNDEDVDEDVDEEMGEINMSEFRNLVLEMRNNKKWYLKSGKCVEDQLYTFGINCQFEQYVNPYLIGYKLRIVRNVIYI